MSAFFESKRTVIVIVNPSTYTSRKGKKVTTEIGRSEVKNYNQNICLQKQNSYKKL